MRLGESPVESEQGCIGPFGDSDIGSVIGGDVVAQLPNAVEEEPVGLARDVRSAEAIQGMAACPAVRAPCRTRRRSADAISPAVAHLGTYDGL